jgi:predicted transcriptional regulator
MARSLFFLEDRLLIQSPRLWTCFAAIRPEMCYRGNKEKALMTETDTKSNFEPDEAEDTRLDAEAMAAYRAGRIVPHAEVAKWLASWGTPEELGCPKPESH